MTTTIHKGGNITPQEATMLLNAARSASAAEYISKWATVLTKVNYGLVGRACPVRMARDHEAIAMGSIPAATNNKRILLNPSITKLFDQHGFKAGASILLGLNFHEVAHNLYSPCPSTSTLIGRLREYAVNSNVPMGQMHGLCNLLEDQRIESLFVVGRSSVASHFTVMWHKLLAATTAPVSAYLSTIGRSYIPAAYRQMLRDAAVADGADEQFLDEAKSLIQRYCSLNLLRDAKQVEGAAVVCNLYELLRKHGYQPPQPPDHGDDERGGGKRGRVSADEQSAADEAAEGAAKNFNEQPEEEGDEADGEGAGKGDGEGDESDGAGADGDGEGEESDDGASGSGEGADTDPAEGEGEGAGGNGNGSGNEGEESDGGSRDGKGGSGAGRRSDSAKGKQTMDEVVEDLLNDDSLTEEIGRLGDAVDAGDASDVSGEMGDGAEYFRGTLHPSADDKVTAAKVIRTLARLHADSGAVWERRQTSGKAINLIKFKDRKPWETNFFDRYDEGIEDEFEMEVVVLVDVSGSMSNRMERLSKALWVLRRSFKEIGAKMTGIAFDDDPSLLFRPTDPVSPEQYPLYRAGGNTAPMGALTEAQRIFDKSSAKTKVLLVLTDGSWSDSTICDGLIHRMNENGVYTILSYISNYSVDLSQPPTRHYCRVGVAITDPSDLVVLMEDFVKIKVAAARR